MLSWSIIIQSATQYFEITFSIQALPISSDLDSFINTVIKQFVTSSMIHNMTL